MLINFRDIGGIPVSSGHLKSGFFYRSGQLVDLSGEDINVLKNHYKIKQIYDFRSKQEITEEPDTSIDSINYTNIDILADYSKTSIASLRSMKTSVVNTNSIEQAMLNTYKELVTCESALNGYHLFLTDVLKKRQPFVFHCFAGKDRTGFAAALLLKIAGASEELIWKDYLETNRARKDENMKILYSLKDKFTPKQLNSLEVALTVQKQYLSNAKDQIEKNFGTFDNYLFDGLRLDTGYVKEFRNIFVNTLE